MNKIVRGSTWPGFSLIHGQGKFGGAWIADSVTRKNNQTSIKVAKNDFTRKMICLTALQKLPKNVGDFDKSNVAKGFT